MSERKIIHPTHVVNELWDKIFFSLLTSRRNSIEHIKSKDFIYKTDKIYKELLKIKKRGEPNE